MSVFKRLSATFSSRIDHLVGQIENHDAVVEAAIRDARQAVAKSKVRLSRLKADGIRLRRKRAELLQAESQWTQRAKDSATQDENRALECLRRRQDCQQQITELDKALGQHAQLEARLTQDIQQAEARVGEMAQQRNLMRTRQSAAEALNTIANIDDATANDVAAAFERWEVQVTEAELEAGNLDYGDSLEQEYLDNEQREDLRKQLKALLNDTQEDGNNDQ